MRKAILWVLLTLFSVPSFARSPQLQIPGQSGAPDLSTTGNSSLYYDSGSNTLFLSENGGAYVALTTGSSSGFLQSANNLSDVASQSTSRTNLGLGTMATQNITAVSAMTVTGATSLTGGLTSSTLSAGASTVTGLSTTSIVNSGSLSAAATTVTGLSATSITDSGTLKAAATTITGVLDATGGNTLTGGTSISGGLLLAGGMTQTGSTSLSGGLTTNTLSSGASTVTGLSATSIADSGTLTATATTVTGLSATSIVNSGSLSATATTVTGLSASSITDSGTLSAGATTITGVLKASGGSTLTGGNSLSGGLLMAGGMTQTGVTDLTGLLNIPRAPTATSISGNINIGNDPFDGTSPNHFNGNSAGTYLAMNVPSAFGGTLIDIQADGNTVSSLDTMGDMTIAGQFSASSAVFPGQVNFNSPISGNSTTGTVDIGDGPFDGSSSGTFNGNASGTYLAINAPATLASTGGNVVDFQIGGGSTFFIDDNGIVNTPQGLVTSSFDVTSSFNFLQASLTGQVLVAADTGGDVGWADPSPGFLPLSTGPLTSITANQIVGVGKAITKVDVKSATAVATTFTCTGNPTFKLFDCGTSAASCTSTPTLLVTLTLTAANTITVGTINSATISAGHFWAWEATAGTCAALNVVGTAGI